MALRAKLKCSRLILALRFNVAVLGLCAACSPISADDNPGEISLRTALETYASLDHLRMPAPAGARLVRFSTADPNGGDDDRGNYLRVEDREKVLVDMVGPGLLTRLWTDNPLGIVRFYFDGSTEPQFETDWQKLAWSPVDPFTAPFHQVPAGGGLLVAFPMPFAEGLKITVAGRTWSSWQADCYSFPPDTKVQTWHPALAPDRDTAKLFTQLLDTLDYPEDFSNGLTFDPIVAPAGLAPGQRLAWKAEKELLVVELRALMPESETADDIWITLPGAGGVAQEAPLSLVLGGGFGIRRGTGILFGRISDPVKLHALYSRIPFTIKAGEEVVLENKGSSRTTLGLELASVPASSSTPRIVLAMATVNEAGARTAELVAGDGVGRLVAVNGFLEDRMDSAALEADETIRVDGGEVSIAGTSIKDFYETPSWPEPPASPALQKKAVPLTKTLFGAASPVSGTHLGLRGNHAFLPWGVPFNDRLEFSLEKPACSARILLIGQVFEGHPNDTPNAHAIPFAPLQLGRIVVPDMGHDSDAAFSGVFERPGESLSESKLELFLPHGWNGTLTSGSAQGTVLALDNDSAPVTFECSVHSPANTPAGPTNLVVQATAIGENGTALTPEKRIARFTVDNPGGEVVKQWTMNDLTPMEGDWANVSNREIFLGTPGGDRARITVKLPEGFEPLPGDVVVVELAARTTGHCGEVEVTLQFDGIGPVPNAKYYPEVLRKLIPEDGSVVRTVESGEEPRRIVFDLGRYFSWLGSRPRQLELKFASIKGGEVEIASIELKRAPAKEVSIGQTRLVALADAQLRSFNFPKAKRVLAGGELIRALSVVAASGSEGLDLGGWAEAHLANLEHNAFGPRLATKPYVPFVTFKAVTVAEFLAAANGSRLQVKHPALAGARRLGIRFGYSPAGAEVGIINPAGQLLARVNLFCTEPVVPGAFTEITLPEPNATDTLFIEVLDSPPGSLGRHVPVERIAVFE